MINKPVKGSLGSPFFLVSENDIDFAARVHYSFIPDHFISDWLEIAVRIQPLGKIGGDYCGIFPLEDDRLIITMCDAVGHGIASALYAARINTFVLLYAASRSHPCDLIDALNEFLCQRPAMTGMYASFFTVVIDLRTRMMEYAGAAHPAALFFRHGSDTVELLESETTLVGLEHPLPLACSVNRYRLDPGDRLLLYTDGLSDAKSKNGKRLGSKGISQRFRKRTGCSSTEINEHLLADAGEFCDGKFSDDVLLLTVAVG